jgi:hypothetical protein
MPDPPPVTSTRFPCRLGYTARETLLARAVAGLARAAERHVIVDACRRQIDHHHPGPHRAAEMPGVLEGVGDDPRRQAELPAIGDLQRFLVVSHADGAGDRTEHFLIVDPHVGRRVRNDSRRHVPAALRERQRIAAGKDLAAFVARNPDIT